jgi:RHS repeat-associated protein
MTKRIDLLKFTIRLILLVVFIFLSISTSSAGDKTDVRISTGKKPSERMPPPNVKIRSDPGTIPCGESAVLRWKITGAETVSIDNGIGDVDSNGSITVSPTETTTYAITATGPGGTTTDTATVTVIMPLEDVDLGIDGDEQEGGGGLVGETIRILNGNVIEARSDIRFSSPNRLGLVLEAFYNSRSDIEGSMGYGWSHTYETSLYPSFGIKREVFLKITDCTDKAHYFMKSAEDEYIGIFTEKSHIRKGHGRYVWYIEDGSRYGFSFKGRLMWVEDVTGNRIELAYGRRNNRLKTVTDMTSGRALTFHYNTSNLLEYITGPVIDAIPDGVWVTYGYDANNNLISVTYADGSGFDYSYTDTNDIHNLTEKRDKLNHLIDTWGYDDNDRTLSNFSRDGKGVNSVVYTTESQVNVTDAYGKEREYFLEEVSGRKRVSAIINGPGGAGAFPWSTSNAVSWIYDKDMNPIEVEYAGGSINQYLDYDERGNPETVILAFETDEEKTIHYTYHPNINTPLTRIEPSILGSGDKETIWDYDNDYDDIPNENPTSLVSRIVEKGFTKDGSGSVVSYAYVTTFTYNSKGQVLSIDGPLPGTSDTTTFSYDSTTGDLLSITRPLIGATTFSDYDAAGEVGYVTDINGRSKNFTYDGRGRVKDIDNNADSSTSSVVYNTAGLPDTKTDEDGVNSAFEYDTTYGRLFKRFDHEGNYIEYGYDDQGNVIEKGYYDPSNNRTNRKRYLYQGTNMPGLLYREINADDTYTQYGYDLDANVVSIRDPNGNITYYNYDHMSRLITVTQPGSIVTAYTYDGHGNLQSVTDAESHTTTYQYDDLARLVSTTSPDTGTVTYTYDEAGNPINKTDAKAISVDYSYDVLNRLTDINFPDSTQDIDYTYDSGTNGIGQRTGMADESGDYAFGYNNRGRLTGKTSIIDGITYALTRTYTPGGRVISITYPTGRTVDYHRETCACSVDSIDTTYNGSTTTLMNNLSYRPFGGAKVMDNGAGGAVGSTYDKSGRLTVSNPGATHERTYAYDNNGNLLTITSPSTPYYNRVYEYDTLNRLTSASAEDAWGEIDYTYDDVGNRLTEITDDDSDTYGYVTGTNILDTVMDTDTIRFTHDANGNITGIGTKTLTYNQDNRFISVADDGVTLGEYTYNGLGQRIIKIADGTTTVFHYYFDGNIIGESDESGEFSKEYLYRGGSRLAMVDVSTGEVYYYGNDQLGTPEILTDSTNIVVWEAIYKPFGEAEVNEHSTLVNNFRFPGQYYDAETGLHYNYHRYYDPRIGRYLTPDPIGLDASINLFSYVANNPINDVDPTGLYRELVHYSLTALLALDVGFSYCASLEIARADQDIDDNPETSPIKGGRKARKLWHFPSQQRINTLLNLAYLKCDLGLLGKALHVLQDSFSHEGYNPGSGHLVKSFGNKLGINEDPDDPKSNPDKTNRMVNSTHKVLEHFANKCPKERDKCCCED